MTKGTALGEARGRFVESLPERARELRGALALITAAPGADRPREELIRRLQSLHASAQVFRLSLLADAIRERVDVLQISGDETRHVSDEELESITNLIAVMPTMGQRRESLVGPLPTGPTAASNPAPPRRRKDTAKGFPALHLESTPFPPPDAPRGVMALLVVDSAEAIAQLRRAVTPSRCEILVAKTADEVLHLAKLRAPDVILIGREEASRSGSELITRLRSRRLTASIPIALIHERGDAMSEHALLELGADTQIERNDAILTQRIAALGTVTRRPQSLERIGDTTIEELAERLADELHRGIVEAVSSGERLSVGDGSDLLAAAWTAVEEVRAKISERTQGRVRYREAGGPVFLSMESSSGAIAAPLNDDSLPLEGCTLVVADDDPSIVWFFANLLQEAGAQVLEAHDGDEALALVRVHGPDAVISDIVMPTCGGLELCRTLAEDPAFAELPVVLISWKDDFLERMKELRSGAKGYLRKEADNQVILSRVEEVLRPRIHLRQSLKSIDVEEREAGGRIEGLGVYSILQAVTSALPDSRVVVQGSHHFFEADIRGGHVIDVTRTSDDGSFRRGQGALQQMLGVAHGRYTIERREGRAARTSVREGEGDAVDLAAGHLRAIARVLGSARINAIEVMRFDDEFIAPSLAELPSTVATGIRRVRSGVAPRVVIADTGGVRGVLLDLGQRGGVSDLRGPGGKDLVAAARTELDSNDARRLESMTPSAQTEAHEESTADERFDDDDSSEALEPVKREDEPSVVVAAWSSMLDEVEVEDEVEDEGHEQADLRVDALAERWDEDSDTTPGSPLGRRNAEAAELERLKTRSTAPSPAAHPPGLLFILLGLFFVGGAGTCWATRHGEVVDETPDETPDTDGRDEVAPVEAASPAGGAELPVASGPMTVRNGPQTGAEGMSPTLPTSELAFGTSEALPAETQIEADEGLLVVLETDEDITVRLGGDSPRFLGSPPLRVPLEQARYELRFETPSASAVRYVFVRAGQSRIVAPPSLRAPE